MGRNLSFIVGVVFYVINLSVGQDICDFNWTGSTGNDTKEITNEGYPDASAVGGCMCEIRRNLTAESTDSLNLQLQLQTTTKGICPPFILLEKPGGYYFMCGGSSMNMKDIAYGIEVEEKARLTLYNNERANLISKLTTSGNDFSITCTKTDKGFDYGSCPCPTSGDDGIDVKPVSGDDWSLKKRLTIGFCSALALLGLAMVFIFVHYNSKRKSTGFDFPPQSTA